MKQSELVAKLAALLLAPSCLHGDGVFSKPSDGEIRGAVILAHDILHATRLEGARRHKEALAASASASYSAMREYYRDDDEAPVNDR